MIDIRYCGLLIAWIFLSLASLECAASGSPSAQPTPVTIDAPAPVKAERTASQDQVERLAAILDQMMPFGALFDRLAQNDPEWPMQGLSKPAKREHLKCMRAELSTDGYRRQRLAEVLAYAEENPLQLKADIEVLDRGAANLYAKFISAGMDSTSSGVETDPQEVVKQAKPEELMHFMTFFTDPSYAPLRKLVGVGEALDPDRTGEENREAGRKVGGTLARKYLLMAMATCDVPMSEVM